MANLPSYMKLVALIFFKACTAEENCTLRNNAGRTIGQEWPSLRQLFPYYVSGYDYENVPVLVIELGRWDNFYVSENMDQYEEELKVFDAGFFGCYEKLSNTTIISNDGDEILVGQFALILDFEYFSIKHLSTSKSARMALNFWKGSKRFDNNVAYGFYINSKSCLNTVRTTQYLPRIHRQLSVQKYHFQRDLILKHTSSLPLQRLNSETWQILTWFWTEASHPCTHSRESLEAESVNAAAENLALLSKPLMSKAFGRSELYGTRRQSWLPALLRKIPKSDLPTWYGGDKACSKVTLGCL